MHVTVSVEVPTFGHVHLASTLSNDAHDSRMRDRRLYMQSLIVNLAKTNIVALLSIHLDFERENLEQCCSA